MLSKSIEGALLSNKGKEYVNAGYRIGIFISFKFNFVLITLYLTKPVADLK